MTCLLAEQDLCVPNYIRDYVAALTHLRHSVGILRPWSSGESQSDKMRTDF